MACVWPGRNNNRICGRSWSKLKGYPQLKKVAVLQFGVWVLEKELRGVTSGLVTRVTVAPQSRENTGCESEIQAFNNTFWLWRLRPLQVAGKGRRASSMQKYFVGCACCAKGPSFREEFSG